MASPEPFIPSVLRSTGGTVAIQVDPATLLSGSTRVYYRLAHLGPDGIELLKSRHMPPVPGAVLELPVLRHQLTTSFTELQPSNGQARCRYEHD